MIRLFCFRCLDAILIFLLQLILGGLAFSTTTPAVRSFVRTDAPPALTIFDSNHKVVYATTPGLNQVIVISSDQHTINARISVPGAFAMDLSPDGTRLVVGSGNSTLGGAEVPMLTLIDTSTLQIVGRYQVPLLDQARGVTIPFSLVWTSNGTVLIAAQMNATTFFGLIQWDPAQNTFWSRPLPDPSVEAESLARSADHSKVLINDSSTSGAHLVLYDANTDGFVATGFADGFYTAVSPDGTLIAVEGVDRLFLFDSGLNPLQTLLINSYGQKPMFSADGKSLYVSQGQSYWVYETTTFMPLGQIPAFGATSGTNASLDGIDDLGELFGALDRGVAFNAFPISSKPPSSQPSISGVAPSSGSTSSPRSTTINGAFFVANSAVYFGNQPATAVTISSSNVMTVTPPSSTTTGPVDVTVETPDGGVAIAEQAYTYGPYILYLQNNAGSTAGGSSLQVLGYGFDFDPSQIQLTIGGRPAQITNVSSILISPFLLPIQRIYANSPSGPAGAANVTVTTPSGSTTLHDGFYYYSFSAPTGATATGEMVYDSSRQVLYVTNDVLNEIDVLSPAKNSVIATLPCGQGPVGISLSPDKSKLVVANWTSQSVSVVDIASGTQQQVVLNINGNGPGSVHPLSVAVANNGTALVGAVDVSLLDNGDLFELDLAPASLTLISNAGGLYLTGDIELHAFSGGSKVWVGSGSRNGSDSMGARIWDASSGSFTPFSMNGFIQSDITEDGLVLDGSGSFYSATALNYSFVAPLDLLAYLYSDVGEKLHPGGGLLLTPNQQSAGSFVVSMYDVNSGELLRQIQIPANVGSTFDTMALDDTGNRLFVSTDSGVITITLAPLPASIGSINPNEGLTTGGDTVTVRGSNFLKGAIVKFGGVNAATTLVDQNTLQVITPPQSLGQVGVDVTNPDGSSYTLSSSFTYVSSIPGITSTSPSSAMPGSGLGLTLFGSNFVSGAAVQWNGVRQPTVFLDSNTLQTEVSVSTVGSNTGSAKLAVVDPDGAVSNTFLLPIAYPPPQLAFDNNGYDFGPQLVKTPSPPFTTYLGNPGPGPAAPSLSATGDFSETNNCPATMLPNTICTLMVTFKPSAVGARAGTLEASATGGSTISMPLSGRGIPSGPALTSDSYSFDFGQTLIGGSQLDQYSFNIYSVGSSDAIISSVSVSGDYQVTQNTCQGRLSGGSWCYVFLTFAPTAPGIRSGSLRVASNASDSPLTIPLTGIGVQPLVFTPTSLTFGPQLVGTTATQQVMVQNGNKNSIAGLSSVISSQDFTGISNCPENIYPGGNCVINVSFTPGLAADFSETMVLWEEIGDFQGSLNIPATGMGVDFGISIAPGGSNTASITAGQTASYSIGLTDNGYSGTVTIGCSGAPSLSTCSVDPGSAALSGTISQTINVTVQTTAGNHAFNHTKSKIHIASFLAVCPGIIFALIGVTTTRRRLVGAALFCGVMGLAMLSCGGGASGTGGGGGGNTGTPSGIYNLTVSATSGGATRPINLSLTVR